MEFFKKINAKNSDMSQKENFSGNSSKEIFVDNMIQGERSRYFFLKYYKVDLYQKSSH